MTCILQMLDTCRCNVPGFSSDVLFIIIWQIVGVKELPEVCFFSLLFALNSESCSNACFRRDLCSIVFYSCVSIKVRLICQLHDLFQQPF